MCAGGLWVSVPLHAGGRISSGVAINHLPLEEDKLSVEAIWGRLRAGSAHGSVPEPQEACWSGTESPGGGQPGEPQRKRWALAAAPEEGSPLQRATPGWREPAGGQVGWGGGLILRPSFSTEKIKAGLEILPSLPQACSVQG